MSNISRYVKDKISDENYKKMENLIELETRYGFIVYASKENIDSMQEGYRYNPLTDEVFEEWPDDNYVIIGIDNTVGDGGEPILVKVDEDKLPVYYYEDITWGYIEQIANSLDDYIKINNMIAEYSNEIENCELSENQFNDLISEISKISDSNYWKTNLELSLESRK